MTPDEVMPAADARDSHTDTRGGASIGDLVNAAAHNARVAQSHADSALFFAVVALIGCYLMYRYRAEAIELIEEAKEIAKGSMPS